MRHIAVSCSEDAEGSDAEAALNDVTALFAPDESEVQPTRMPPPYPDGLHDAAKADREGPFWSSLGEPGEPTRVPAA